MRRIDFNEKRTVNFNPKDYSSKQRIQIIIYRNLDLMGQYLFSSSMVTIGSGKKADIILEDNRISEIQAAVHLQNDTLIISDRTNRLSVYLNGKPIKAALLTPLDLIEIGDYSLKIKLIEVSGKKMTGKQSFKKIKKDAIPLRKENIFKKKRNCGKASEEIFDFPSYKKQKGRFSEASSKPLNKNWLHVSEDKLFPEEYFKLKDNEIKEINLPAHSKRVLNELKSKVAGEKYSEDFFKLPPYEAKKPTGSSLISKESPKIKKGPHPHQYEEYTDDFFKLPPYKIGKQVPPESNGDSDRIFPKRLHEKNRTQKVDSLLSNRSSKKAIKIADNSNHAGSLEPSLKRYDLIFSGKLKSGWTLIKVKASLNRRFGIDYRKLGNLVLNRKIVLKRNITREKALKLYRAFDVSGAICSIIAIADPPEDSGKPKKAWEKTSDSAALGKKTKKLISIFERSSQKIFNFKDEIGGFPKHYKKNSI